VGAPLFRGTASRRQNQSLHRDNIGGGLTTPPSKGNPIRPPSKKRHYEPRESLEPGGEPLEFATVTRQRHPRPSGRRKRAASISTASSSPAVDGPANCAPFAASSGRRASKSSFPIHSPKIAKSKWCGHVSPAGPSCLPSRRMGKLDAGSPSGGTRRRQNVNVEAIWRESLFNRGRRVEAVESRRESGVSDDAVFFLSPIDLSTFRLFSLSLIGIEVCPGV